MKKILLPLIAMLACMVSCQKDFSTLRLEIESYNGEKLHLNNGNYACWDNGDSIVLNMVTKTIALDANAHTATIKLTQTEANATDFYALYGGEYSPVENDYVVEFPTNQNYVVDDDGVQILHAPMAAHGKKSGNDASLVFKNLGAILAIDVKGSVTISSIKVSTNDGSDLSGSYIIADFDASIARGVDWAGMGEKYVNLNFSTPVQVLNEQGFYISVPVSKVKDLTITITDNEGVKHAISTGRSFQEKTFVRNKIYVIPVDMAETDTLSNDVKYIYYTTESEEIPDLEHNYGVPQDWNLSTYGQIAIPATCTTIPEYVFGGIDLQTVTLPEGITSIGLNAFFGCAALTVVNLPSTLISIGDEAFYDCISLSIVNCYATSVPNLGGGVFDNISNPAELHVPTGCADDYNRVWNRYNPYFSSIDDNL